MRLSDCPEGRQSREEISVLLRRGMDMLPSTDISPWDKTNWAVALTLAIGGITLSPVSGGLSLLASVLGILWLLTDIFKKIRDSSRDSEHQKEASDILERLDFLKWCLAQR